MKKFLHGVQELFFGRRPALMFGRSAGALLLGILLLWRPETARLLLAGLVWLPPAVLALIGLRLALKPQKSRWAGVALLAGCLGLGVYLLTLGSGRLALWGAAAWALLAAAGLLWNSFFSPGRRIDWQMRTIGVVGSVLSGLAGVLFLSRGNANFLQYNVLFGVFFISLALLTAAEASWQYRR